MNEIQKYLRYRQALIDQYIRGDMTKREYLNKNLDAVLGLNIKPFRFIDTVEKGLFNYQYYNAMAKDAKSLSMEINDKDAEFRLRGESNSYYHDKDRATMAILKLIDYENISAYFIKVRSKYLKGKIFEIVLYDYNAIMHSKNLLLLENIKKAGAFKEGMHTSLIDGYINQRY